MAGEVRKADVIIIGGGPAGLSAASWCAELGLDTVLLERESELGGQLLWIYNPVTNYLGIESANGRELRDRFLRHQEEFDFEIVTGAGVESIDVASLSVGLIDGRHYAGNDLVIATGVRRRKLGVRGEDEFVGRGLLVSGARDKSAVKGKRVVVIGGGDAALENAIMFADAGAAKVVVVHRRTEFTARDEFLRSAQRDPVIEFRSPARVKEIVGGESITGVVVSDSETIAADAVLIRIGVEPNTELLRGQLDLDPRGYVCVDARCRTSQPHVYSIGDVAHPISPTIATAVGTGATAAKSIRSDKK